MGVGHTRCDDSCSCDNTDVLVVRGGTGDLREWLEVSDRTQTRARDCCDVNPTPLTPALHCRKTANSRDEDCLRVTT